MTRPNMQLSERDKERVAMLAEAMRKCGLPRVMERASWSHLSEETRLELRQDTTRDLMLWGGVGTGKSTAATCLMRNYLLHLILRKGGREANRVERGLGDWPDIKHLDFLPQRGGAEWHDFRSVLSKVQDTYGSGKTQDFLDRLVELEFLVLDEVVPALTNDKARVIEWLLAQRMAYERQTVLTSNYSPHRLLQEIKKAAGDGDDHAMDRLGSRLASSFTVIEFTGKDMRKRA